MIFSLQVYMQFVLRLPLCVDRYYNQVVKLMPLDAELKGMNTCYNGK